MELWGSFCDAEKCLLASGIPVILTWVNTWCYVETRKLNMEKSDMFVHCFHSAFTSMKDILYILAVFQKKKKTYTRSFYFYPSNYNLHLRSVNKTRLNVTDKIASSGGYNRGNRSAQIISMNLSVLSVHMWEWEIRELGGEGLGRKGEHRVEEKWPELIILFWELILPSSEKNKTKNPASF